MRAVTPRRRSTTSQARLAIAPKQDRSRDTERRLVASLARLLEARPYERITVPQIAAGAGLAVGSVYRRFPSKERLLLFAADELMRTHVAPALARTAEREQWARLPGRDRMARYLAFVAKIFVRYRPLLRAVSVVSRLDIDPDLTALVTVANRGAHGRIRQLLLDCRTDITHSDPARAIDLAILWTSAALREVILFDERVSSLARPGGRAWLVEELADGMWAYLTDRPRARPR